MFISYRAHQNIGQIVQWLKGTSSRVLLQEFPHLKKQYWGRHLWARGYFAVTSGTITDEMINEYIDEQEGEAVQDDSRFEIDPSEPLALQARVVQFVYRNIRPHLRDKRLLLRYVKVGGGACGKPFADEVGESEWTHPGFRAQCAVDPGQPES